MMNAVKRQRPSIPPDDIERLLFHLEDARNYIVKYGAAQDFHSLEKEATDRTMNAIDDLAEQITGTRNYFWCDTASAGGNEIAFQRSTEKQVKRRRLMGVCLPLRALMMTCNFTNELGVGDIDDSQNSI